MSEKGCTFWLLTFSFLLLTCASARAESVVFAYDNYAPYSYLENGRAAGQTVEKVRAICEGLGLEAKFVFLPFARALMDAQDGTVDAIIAIFRNREREEYLYYPNYSFQSDDMLLLVNKSSGLKPQTLHDVMNRKVGAVRGYFYGEGVLETLSRNVVFVKDVDTLYQMLIERRFDAALGYRASVNTYFKRLDTASKIGVGFVITHRPFYVAFSKKMGKRGKELAKLFGEEAAKLDRLARGELE